MIPRVLVLLVLVAGIAHAAPGDLPTVTDAQCESVDTTPGALLQAPTGDGMPIPWTDVSVTGTFAGNDTAATVRALIGPTLESLRTTLTADRWKDVAAIVAKLGYQLVRYDVVGAKLELQVEPLAMVRHVAVDMHQGLLEKQLDDEVRRRMLLRTGSYLPAWPIQRACERRQEQLRIEAFLMDEGYFDADASAITFRQDGTGVDVRVKVDLKSEYTFGTPTLLGPRADRNQFSDQAIVATFQHKPFCFGGLCLSERFTRAQQQQDVARLKKMYQDHGYPGVRIEISDPKVSLDRRTKRVNPGITIEQRRKLDVDFEGDPVDDEVRGKLTFDAAGSADDVEADQSARAIETLLQERGFFDAHVTWRRERFPEFDRIIFHVVQGATRDVKSVEFVGAHAIGAAKLANLVATKPAGFTGQLLGTTTSATSAQLGEDVARIAEAYRRAGYREARVSVSASPTPDGLGDPALTAGLLALRRGDGLYVRFTIDEGAPTRITRVVVEHGEAGKTIDDATCTSVLGELASELGAPRLAHRSEMPACAAVAPHLAYREDDVALTRDRLRDFMYRSGRPRAQVEQQIVPIGPREVEVHYAIRDYDQVRIGAIVIRGNFRTSTRLIRDLLKFHQGDVLTTDALAEAARRLRATGLFDAVNIDLPDLDSGSASASAIVRVEERYDYLAQLDLELGYSSVNHLFVTSTWGQHDLLHRGIGFSLSGTYGLSFSDFSNPADGCTQICGVDSTLTFPNFLLRTLHVGRLRLPNVQLDLTGFAHKQNTPRFGLLDTEGVTIDIGSFAQTPRTANHPAHTTSLGLRYDFRLRTINVDALRPIGIDMDFSQVAVQTRTGSIGLVADFDHRVDRAGQASPLAPEAGWRLNLSASIAAPWLLGQDTFIKLSADGSKFFAIGKNLVIRTDLRWDEGIPLGGAVLLPEVERYFAGGDNTVRGYNDDSMLTEVVQVPVPPLGGGVTQIRVIPAGGNIRVLGSVDAQVRIWKVFAGALFSDAGMITNEWGNVTVDDIRPSVGMGLRALTPFGIGALEYAIPLNTHLGDDPRGRIHFYFAARAQF